MTLFNPRPFLICLGICLLSLTLSNCESTQKSDERILRQTFQIPEKSTLTSIFSQPTGWGPRENLRIHATFQLSDTDFASYQAEHGDRWSSWPMSPQLLLKVTGNEQVTQSSSANLDPTLTDNSTNSTMNAAILERWNKWLYLGIETGWYQCLTAGNNILHEDKIHCLTKSGDLNDFMIAVLDDDAKTFNITVRTGY